MAEGLEVVEIEAWANEGDLHAVQLKTAERGSHWVRFTSGAGLSLIAALQKAGGNFKLNSADAPFRYLISRRRRRSPTYTRIEHRNL